METKRPEVGETVIITEVREQGTNNLKVGDTMVVGPDKCALEPDPDGFIWLQSPNYMSADGKYGWVKWQHFAPKVGQRIRIVEALPCFTIRGGKILEPGDEIIVGCVCQDPVNGGPQKFVLCPGFVWVSTGDVEMGQPGQSYGWVKWEPVEPALTVSGDIELKHARIFVNGVDVSGKIAPVEVELPDNDDYDRIRARCARQRRELRRINAVQRLLRLENDVLKRANEDATSALIAARKTIRMYAAAEAAAE